MSQVTNTGSSYERLRDVTQPCPQCDGKYVMIYLHGGIDKAWPACNTCSFDGAPKYKDLTRFDYIGVKSDEEIFKIGYERWNDLVLLVSKDLEENPGKNARQVTGAIKEED